MAQNLDGLKVAVLATDLFEKDELFKPRQALESAGAIITLLSPEDGEIKVAESDKPTDQTVSVDETLDNASPDDFDAVLLPGGAINADHLRIDKEAQHFVQEIDAAGKAHCRNLPRTVAACFGRFGEGAHADEFSDPCRRH